MEECGTFDQAPKLPNGPNQPRNPRFGWPTVGLSTDERLAGKQDRRDVTFGKVVFFVYPFHMVNLNAESSAFISVESDTDPAVRILKDEKVRRGRCFL